jgi:hypothetical protein
MQNLQTLAVITGPEMAEHQPAKGTDSIYDRGALMIACVSRIRDEASGTCHGRSPTAWLPSPLTRGYTIREQEVLSWGKSLSTWTTMQSQLFIVVGEEMTEVDSVGLAEPHVGIWWQGGDGLVAFAQSLDAVEAPMPLIDSDLAHDDLWPRGSAARVRTKVRVIRHPARQGALGQHRRSRDHLPRQRNGPRGALKVPALFGGRSPGRALLGGGAAGGLLHGGVIGPTPTFPSIRTRNQRH